MPTLTGSFSDSGLARLRISVFGVFGEANAQQFDAIIDTGFSGFLYMPLLEAVPLALALTGTTSVILADGSESFNLMALGNVRIADTTRLGGILLHTGTGDDVLLGRQFLGLFRKTLVMTGGALWLVD